MKLVDLKCPNCGEILIKKEDTYYCEACGSTYALDYDESDVEYARLRSEAEREEWQAAHLREVQRQWNETLRNRRASSRKKALIFVVIITIFAAINILSAMLYLTLSGRINGFSSLASSSTTEMPTTTSEEDKYQVSAEDLTGAMSDFIDAGRIVQMNIKECAYWDMVGSVKYYSKTDAVFQEAYLITDIPNVKPKQSNRLVLIYKVTWNNEELGDQECYDAVYFEGLQVNPNGGVISDYSGNTIMRSDAAWGWAMAYSYEDHDQCYRENVTALGGVVTEISE